MFQTEEKEKHVGGCTAKAFCEILSVGDKPIQASAQQNDRAGR